MKITVEFNLPEEETEYKIFMNASKFYNALYQIDSALRNEIKYNDKEYLQEARDLFWEAMNNNGLISLEE